MKLAAKSDARKKAEPYGGLEDPRPRELSITHKADDQVARVRGLSLSAALEKLDWLPSHVFWVDKGPWTAAKEATRLAAKLPEIEFPYKAGKSGK